MSDSAIAILPAAGASRRMGRPKLLLPFRGEPLVAAVVGALRAGGVAGIVLVTAADDDELREWARQAGVATAVNPAPERGMLSSIQEGIAALGGVDALARRGDVLLVSPADLPHLTSRSVAELLRRMAAAQAPLAVPVFEGRRGHPLALAPSLIPEIFHLDPEVGLKQLRDRHEAELLEVPMDDPGVVLDIDTPADYERLGPMSRNPRKSLVIAHRGASGYRPEHTLEAYELAIAMGADFIEPDLVITKDGVLLARHESELSKTTDVADHRELARYRTTKRIDGHEVSGWFSEDLTFAEVTTLRARERHPFRSHEHDGLFKIPTFDEVLDLAMNQTRETGRPIGVYPETKHPSYFRSLGLPLEETLLAALEDKGKLEPLVPVFIQSFETANLQAMRRQTDLPLIQLLDSKGQPWDLAVAGDPRTYDDLATPEGLAAIAGYADGIGPHKRRIVPAGPDGRLLPPTSLVADAHRAGLAVHTWTFRSEEPFLAAGYAGEPEGEYEQFFNLGVDGVFSDFASVAVHVRDAWQRRRS